MKKRLAISVAGMVAAGALLLAAPALAATEFGDNCVANEAEEDITVFEFSAPGNPLPTAAPVSGVITKWKTSVVSEAPPGIPTSLKVLRLNSGAKTAFVVGESFGSVNPGSNTFSARIPVQAGDRLGLYGSSEIGTLFCETPSEKTHLGAYEVPGGGLTGNTFPFNEGDSNARIPVSAVIEPDADGDGYGDETQDLCPQSAALQTACPIVTLDAFSLVGGSAVSVLVATSTDAPVKVTGTVKLGKAGKVKLSAKTKTVKAGKIASFKLKFSTKLKEALKELEPGKKLTLKIVAKATNVAGQVSSDKLKAKLKGQG